MQVSKSSGKARKRNNVARGTRGAPNSSASRRVNNSALVAPTTSADTPSASRFTTTSSYASDTTHAPSATSPQAALPPAIDERQPSKSDSREFATEDLQARVTRFSSTVWERVRGLTPEQWAWIGVFALAALLRFWGLGDKPLHHDESMHAYFSLYFAKNPASYWYDPLLHGPFQFHAEGLMFALILGLQHLFVSGASGDPWINDTTARFVPALFGVGIVVLPLGLRRELGRVGALAAAFLLAVSPAFVYFSRFLREDIYFNFFMFAMVVCAVRFAHTRALRWFIGLFAASVLAYATFEGVYSTFAIFGAFLAVLFIWELAIGLAKLLPRSFSERERTFFSRAGLLLLMGAVGALAAHVALTTASAISAQINAHQAQTDVQVAQLESQTVAIVLYVSILIALLVIATLVWQMLREDAYYRAEDAAALSAIDDDAEQPPAATSYQTILRLDRIFQAPARGLRSLRERVDSARQPLLSLLLSINWVYWFVAFVVGWLIFAAMYFIIPANPTSLDAAGAHCFTSNIGQCFQIGVGRGIWQGLYYWLEQQQIARGGQPWYYYLLLIPLYEQLACVFGFIGIVYTLARPSRFRLFLVWWFVASFFFYSWAGEKMPWLSIHILLPLMLLAGYAVALCLKGCLRVITLLAANDAAAVRATPWRSAGAVVGVVGAALLLIPMLHGMFTLSQVDAADGPHEMMVYVQTTQDVDTVMNKINSADQKLYHGQHKLRIGVGAGEEWPFYWYLRDYTNVYYEYPASDPKAPQVDVLLMLPVGDANHNDATTFLALHQTGYQSHQYRLRAWWDESYKPLPCVPTKAKPCPASANWGSGVGVGNYLSYGSNPPPGATFNAGLAANRLWNWLWFRQPLGATTGSYDFTFIVRNGVPIKP